jgi:hypothetical protein
MDQKFKVTSLSAADAVQLAIIAADMDAANIKLTIFLFILTSPLVELYKL